MPASSLGTPTPSAIVFFLGIVALTLAVTYWAAKRTRSTKEFYAAGRSVSALQNGLALAGDYMSAASFLGIAGLVALKGYDGMIYATGWLVGWPALMFLIAEPLRNLGKYTFADVVAFRLRQAPVRIAAAIGGILTVLFYTIAQMVGSGNLIRLMFGISYEWAVVIVGAIMLAYVLFGGMIATTWVQIIKAVLLLLGVTVLTVLVLAQFAFSPGRLYAAVAATVRPGRARAGRPRDEPGRGRLARPRADARAARTAAHPDALLHRARRQGGAHFGALRHRLHRLLLPDHPDRGVRRGRARRPRGHRRRSTRAATWRRRSSPSCSAARRSSGSSPPSPSRRSSPWSRA